MPSMVSLVFLASVSERTIVLLDEFVMPER
jgi:hypothetical protein